MPDLFAKLPFIEAIEALLKRAAMTKDAFLALDGLARSRAFTMARVADVDILQQVHDQLTESMTAGETFRDFQRRLEALKKSSGWTGTNPYHYQQVYDENVRQNYVSGRVAQAVESDMYQSVPALAPGEMVFRYLPSISVDKREEHMAYYGLLFRWRPGLPLPPLDFGCTCGWEVVFPQELASDGVDPANLPYFEPPAPASGYRFVPGNLPGIDPSRFSSALSGALT